MIRFSSFVPFFYFFQTRVTSWVSRLSWGLIYCVPIFLLVFCYSGSEASFFSDLGYLIAAIFCTYGLYELGYMQNDVVTVREETNPTLRLTHSETTFLQGSWLLVLGVRLFMSAVFLWLCIGAEGWIWYVASLIGLLVVFPVYNHFRSPLNVPLHFLLVSFRFCGPVMLVEPDLTLLCLAMTTFPILNAMERGAEPRYGLRFLQNFVLANAESGRWLYYLLATAVWLLVCGLKQIPFETVIPLVYLFAYRWVTPKLAASSP